MKTPRLFLPSFLAALFAAAPATAVPGFVDNDGVVIEEDSDAYNGAQISVELQAAGDGLGAEYVYCDWTQGDTTVRVYLTKETDTQWTGTLPANHAGSATVVVTAEDAAGVTTSYFPQEYDIAENTDEAQALSSFRYPNLMDWEHLTGGTDPDWMAQNCDRISGLSQMVRLRGTADPSEPPMTTKASFQSGAFYTRKMENGVGSIWFKAKVGRRQYPAGELKILKFTTKGKSSRRTCYYQELATISVPKADNVYEWHQFHVILQNEADIHDEDKCDDHKAQYVIYNNSPTSPIDICDIVLTPIIPDVVVTKDEADYAPGYPSLQDPIEFHVSVSNRWALAPATNFTPMLVWRQEGGRWTSTPMTNRLGRTNTGDGVYACSLDGNTLRSDQTKGVDAGSFEYFYKVGFTGYTPTFPAIKTNGRLFNNVVNSRFRWGQISHLIHTNDLALLSFLHPTEPTGDSESTNFVNECRSPAYKPDFVDAFEGGQYVSNPDVAPDSPAADGTWDFTGKFDISALDAETGYPSADATYGTRSGTSMSYETGTIELPRRFTYLTFLAQDGVRRFRSMFTQVTAVPRPWDDARPGFDIDAGPVPGLDESYPMQLVGDYTWQAIIHQTNAFDAAFGVTGAWRSENGSTEYEHGATNGTPGSPFFWLENKQDPTAINPPSAGDVVRFGSEETQHERWVEKTRDVLVTNLAETAASPQKPLKSARPAGWTIDIPVSYADVSGGAETGAWLSVESAWFRAEPSETRTLVEIVTGGDGTNNWSFITQAATIEVVGYDANDDEIVQTNWPAAWSPQILDGGATTNLWPAQIPDGWLSLNWVETTKGGAVFRSFELSTLVTNGWNLSNLAWETNEIDFLQVDVSGPAVAGAPIASLSVAEESLGSIPLSVSDSGSYVSDARLSVEQEEYREKETYFTYRPAAEPLPGRWLGSRVQIDYDGFLMYRFCTTNGEYQVRRAAWQDFNEWAADINWFSRSFGLYGMKTFTCDLEGRVPSLFGTMSAPGFEEWSGTNEWTELETDHRFSAIKRQDMFWDGFRAKNVWAIQERQYRSSTDETPNKAIRLSPFSWSAGTIETTGSTRTKGRGTWQMNVRSSADDNIAAVYKYGSDWEDYFLAVQIESSAVSPAQGAYASVLFRYNDPYNYAEARLIQKGKYRRLKGGQTKLCRWLEMEVWETVNGETRKLPPKQANGTAEYNKYGDYTTNVRDEEGNNKYFRYHYNEQDHEAEPYDDYMLTRSGGWTLGIAVQNVTVNGQNRPLVEVFLWDSALATATESKKANPVRHPPCFLLDGSLLTGSFGFDVYDVAATFRPWAFPIGAKPEGAGKYPNGSGASYPYYLYIDGGAGNPTQWGAVAADRTETSYEQRTDMLKDAVKPWTVTPAGGNKTLGVTRGVPTSYYRVKTFRTDEEEDTDYLAPVPSNLKDWNADWDELGDSDRVLSVTSYDWTPVKLPMSLWDDTFVQIQALSYGAAGAAGPETNMGAPVFDEFQCDAWLGLSVYDPYLSGEEAADRMAIESWIGAYAAIVRDGSDHKNAAGEEIKPRKWELARSRANPKKDQFVMTPLMENGVGDIIFSYQVPTGTVSFVVELVDEDRNDNLPIGFCTASRSDESKSFYAPALAETTGRIRIRTLPPGEEVLIGEAPNQMQYVSESDVAGRLFLDNIIAHDYPNDAVSSWEAYNMLISSFIDDQNGAEISKNKGLKFDGKASQFDSYRSAVLNDMPNNDTLQGYVYDKNKPFLQTPSIATGIGEVSFWYRASPENTTNTFVKLMAAKTPTAPSDQWIELTADLLNPETGRKEREREAMEALADIDKDTPWTYFSAEFYQGDYTVLRFVTETNNNGRVLLDNVLITEPVRASIDVGSIEFLPGVPICTTNTDVKVKLVNPRKNPTNIRVSLDWYCQTNGIHAVSVPTRLVEYREFDDPRPATVEVDGIVYPVTYYVHMKTAETNDVLNETILPTDLAWGYDNWKDKPGVQTIELATNATDGPYTFYSTNAIPTKRLPHDALVQYCVRVTYEGDFHTDILSEKQGRTKNGFWFENPSWYEPIDLNAFMDTTEQPVAHFWNFTVSTNQMFVNEVQSASGDEEDLADTARRQFVELIGKLNADISGWTVEYAGFDDKGNPTPFILMWTNEVKAASGKTTFVKPENDTADKGWGVYVLGGPDVDVRNQAIFTDEIPDILQKDADGETLTAEEKKLSDVFLYAPGGIAVKRKMGAWADRVCWSDQSSEEGREKLRRFFSLGYRYIGANTRITRSTPRTFIWDGSEDGWEIASESYATPGLFNDDQEDNLWDLEREAEVRTPPLVAAPRIVGYGLTNGVATITFEVCSTNGVELLPDDYYWDLHLSSRLSDMDFTEAHSGHGDWKAIRRPKTGEQLLDEDVTADEAGSTNRFTFSVDVSDVQNEQYFMTIVATPAE